ncbi:nucleotidyltransferase domain-containing protein [Campylobacter devanensis]|uniref:nucleotidyltransferase domain-containing protein n=1 Tax=Campylobacter devanensis TaxID=3161138 RepID=UPI000A343DC1|nr:nucleotidyltransferase domain-containing protein [Campylobacter sp. P0135]
MEPNKNKTNLKLKDDIAKCKNSLKSNFMRLGGRNYGIYQSKEIDKFLKTAFNILKLDSFGEFVLSDDSVPLCVVAIGSYALGEMSVKSNIDLAIIYKNELGYNSNAIAQRYANILKEVGLDIEAKICEKDELLSLANDIELMVLFSHIRLVCGSKILYKNIKNQISKLNEKKKDELISYHLRKLEPMSCPQYLDCSPNLLNGSGGFMDYKRIFWLFSLFGGTLKTNILKYIDEDELSELNLAFDYISSLRSALQISGGGEILGREYLDSVAKIMQTKAKKGLSPQEILLSKCLWAMHTIYIYSRYLARRAFGVKISLGTARICRLPSGLYNIANTIYAPSRKKPIDLKSALKELSFLPDVELKFDISVLIYIKRLDDGNHPKIYDGLKKILNRRYSKDILKLLLDSSKLFKIIKPMEFSTHLASLEGDYSLDESCVAIVGEIENIQDRFVLSLYNDLCANGKMLLKLVALMHQASPNYVSSANIFRSYCAKLDLLQKTINMGINLIKNQNQLIDILSEPISEPIMLNLVSSIKEKQALKLLYILTYARLKARNLNHFSDIDNAKLRQIYDSALSAFDSDESLMDSVNKRTKKIELLKKQREFIALDKDIKEQILRIESNLLFSKYSQQQIIDIALRASECSNIDLELTSHSLQIIAKSHWNMAMALRELRGFDLAYMEICELFDGKSYIRLDYNSSIDKSKNEIIQALCSKEKPQYDKPVILPNEVSFDMNYSQNYAKLNINAKDQRGFMIYILSMLSKFQIKLANARIQTIKNRTRNMFLLSINDDLKSVVDEFLKEIITE